MVQLVSENIDHFLFQLWNRTGERMLKLLFFSYWCEFGIRKHKEVVAQESFCPIITTAKVIEILCSATDHSTFWSIGNWHSNVLVTLLGTARDIFVKYIFMVGINMKSSYFWWVLNHDSINVSPDWFTCWKMLQAHEKL